jgi:predicted transcriptional regulator
MSSNDKTILMVEIVRFCQSVRDKDQIMNRMNLNNVYAESYLSILTRQRLLMKNNDKYLRTKQGNDFLIVHDMFRKIVQKSV